MSSSSPAAVSSSTLRLPPSSTVLQRTQRAASLQANWSSDNDERRIIMHLRVFPAVAAALLVTGAMPTAYAQDKSIVVASTTSTQDSGLFSHILPQFKAKTGIDVKVVAQGTGEALDTARRGDADVVFVHAKALEEQFVADGYGVQRFDVMYNDFVLIGPKSDPAKIRGPK